MSKTVMLPSSRVFAPSARHAIYDPQTGLYSSAHFPSFEAPSTLTIDQFLLSYKPTKELASHPRAENHFRPDPAGQTWLIDSVTNKSYTFEACRERTHLIASAFRAHLGLSESDVLAIYAPNDIDYPIVMWGAFETGAIVSGANPAYTAQELVYQLKVLSQHYSLKGIVTHPDSLKTCLQAAELVGVPKERIVLMSSLLGDTPPAGTPGGILTLDGLIKRHSKELLPIIQPKPGEARDKIAFLSFSSGTTGLPKAVRIPHRAVIANIMMISRHLDEDVSGKRVMAVLPYYHIFGLVVVLHSSLYRNLANVVVPKFAFESFLDTIIRFKISQLYLVPPMVVLLVKHQASVRKAKELSKSMEQILCGAAPLSQELVNEFYKLYPNVRLGQGYGMTETATWVAGVPRMKEPSPGSSAGVIAPNVQLKIVDQFGTPLKFGSLGEILVRSPSNALDYLGNTEATDETFDKEGFVHTGDEGYIDEHGWIYVVDRLKELIKVKGNQVAPSELEGHLLSHPAVADVCVIGVPDDYAGEVPRAYVALSPSHRKKDQNLLEREISQFVSEHKIRYKWLDGGIEFLDSIPKNASGKLLRRTLRDHYKTKLASKSSSRISSKL